MSPAADMSPPQAAAMLGCSPPTVRALIEDGLLPAVATQKANRTYHLLSRTDVEAYIERFGTFHPRPRRPSGARLSRRPTDPADDEHGHQSLTEEVRALRELVENRAGTSPESRAEVVALREALQLQRAAMAALVEADDHRSAGVKLLHQAMESFESADACRKRATELLDGVVGSLTLPRSAAELTE